MWPNDIYHLNQLRNRIWSENEPYKSRRIKEKRDLGAHSFFLDHRGVAALSSDQPRYSPDGKRKGIFVQVCFRNRSVAYIFWEDDIRPPFPSGDHGKNASHEYDLAHALCLGSGKWDYLHGSANDRAVLEKPGNRISLLTGLFIELLESLNHKSVILPRNLISLSLPVLRFSVDLPRLYLR